MISSIQLRNRTTTGLSLTSQYNIIHFQSYIVLHIGILAYCIFIFHSLVLGKTMNLLAKKHLNDVHNLLFI